MKELSKPKMMSFQMEDLMVDLPTMKPTSRTKYSKMLNLNPKGS